MKFIVLVRFTTGTWGPAAHIETTLTRPVDVDFFRKFNFHHRFVDSILTWIVTSSWWSDQPSGSITLQRTKVDTSSRWWGV